MTGKKKKAREHLTRREERLVNKIIKRGVANGWICGPVDPKHWYAKTTARIDITVTHLRLAPLDLNRWLEASDFNFLHDLAGIARHMDRSGDGALRDEFRPRFCLKEV